MGTHRKSDQASRKAKYQRQFARTEANKKKHISLMERLKALKEERKNK